MKLYRFLSGPDDASFCHKVTVAVNKGWHLFGSPTYAYDRKNKTMRCGQEQGLASVWFADLWLDTETKTMRCGQAVVKDVDGVDYEPGIKLGDY